MRSRNTANRKALTTAETEQGKRMEVALMSNELSIYEAMGGTYTEVDGLFYPDITVSEESDISRGMVGKYKLRDYEYNEDLMKLYVMGGGAKMVEMFGKYNPDRTTFNHDICANAKGYEYFCYMMLRQKMRK